MMGQDVNMVFVYWIDMDWLASDKLSDVVWFGYEHVSQVGDLNMNLWRK